jgi:hypothetical protein
MSPLVAGGTALFSAVRVFPKRKRRKRAKRKGGAVTRVSIAAFDPVTRLEVKVKRPSAKSAGCPDAAGLLRAREGGFTAGLARN